MELHPENPADVWVRAGFDPQGEHKVLGWGLAGTVLAVGAEASLFKPGGEVHYSGMQDRPGCYVELQTMDECSVGYKPKLLSFAQAAALPLTSITADQHHRVGTAVRSPRRGACIDQWRGSVDMQVLKAKSASCHG